MKARLAIIAAALLCLSAMQHAKADEWTTQDKSDHFAVGSAIALTGTHVFRDRRVGFALGAAAGLAKEFLDSRSTNHTVSAKDFAVTAAGAFVGAYAPGVQLQKRHKTWSLTYTMEF